MKQRLWYHRLRVNFGPHSMAKTKNSLQFSVVVRVPQLTTLRSPFSSWMPCIFGFPRTKRACWQGFGRMLAHVKTSRQIAPSAWRTWVGNPCGTPPSFIPTISNIFGSQNLSFYCVDTSTPSYHFFPAAGNAGYYCNLLCWPANDFLFF